MREFSWGVSVVVGILALACGTPAEPPVPIANTEPGALASLSLDSVTVGEGVRELSRATNLALVVDPSAEHYAACARFSVSTPTARARDELTSLVSASLSTSGFTLTRRPEGLLLSHDGVTRPLACTRTGLDLESLAASRARRGSADDSTADDSAADDSTADDSTADDSTADDFAEAIRQISDTEWEVLRSHRDDPAFDSTSVMRSGRLVPQEVDDDTAGLGLYGIRRSSVLGALGFRNGDTVIDINGHELTALAAALESYRVLRGADRYDVRLSRRGEIRTHVIRVVDAFSAPAAE